MENAKFIESKHAAQCEGYECTNQLHRATLSSESKWGVGTHTAVCFMLLSQPRHHQTSKALQQHTRHKKHQEWLLARKHQEWLLARVISFASIPISRFHPPSSSLGPLFGLSWLIVGVLYLGWGRAFQSKQKLRFDSWRAQPLLLQLQDLLRPRFIPRPQQRFRT